MCVDYWALIRYIAMVTSVRCAYVCADDSAPHCNFPQRLDNTTLFDIGNRYPAEPCLSGRGRDTLHRQTASYAAPHTCCDVVPGGGERHTTRIPHGCRQHAGTAQG